MYTSPRSRCVDTGAAIANATQANAQKLDALMDIDYGQWQGLTHGEAGGRWPAELKPGWKHRIWRRYPAAKACPWCWCVHPTYCVRFCKGIRNRLWF
nr:histidine phosphatase family protein [Pseudomonas knackmussii]